jgi:lipase
MPIDNRRSLTITREARGRVAADGVDLAFGYWPGRGDPIVALHGITATHLAFGGIAECLGGRRPLFAIDLRGRGDSDKPRTGPFGMAQHARDVAAAMHAMGLGASVIMGHSMGAFVAAALAQQNPELVAGLVLIDGGYAATITQSPETGLSAALSTRITQLRRTYPSREVYREFWRSQPHFPAADWGPWIEAFLDYELGGEASELRPKAHDEAVEADLMEGLKRDQIVARLQSIRVPVHMFRATAGFVPGQPPLYTDTTIEQMRGFVPGMKDELIPDTTHYTIVLGRRGATRIADLLTSFPEP